MAELILSARVSENSDVFSDLLSLHVSDGSTVADVTYGKGAFWSKVEPGRYDLIASDIQTGCDCRNLPYDSGTIDCVVLDPPYMEGLFRKSVGSLAGRGSHSSFRERYSSGTETLGGPKWHGAVIDLYQKAGCEAMRVLKVGGVFVVKCQDEVSANRNRFTHVELINYFESIGFCTKDLFVVVRNNKPSVVGMKKQVHARKNHSYFLVFIKKAVSNG
jgi:tRNA G10  N-methylase Trm11